MIFRYLANNWSRIIKFLVIGVVTLAANLMAFNMLDKLFNIYLSISMAYVFTTFLHYALNRSFAFGSTVSHSTSIPKYIFMIGNNYLIVLVVTFFYHDIFGFRASYLIFVTSFSTAASSFVFMNHFVFKKVS